MTALSSPPRTIEISAPQLGPEVEALVLEVLRSGRLAQGPMVERFEALCADMSGCTHAVAVSSGTTALAAALEAHGIGAGDEVITTPFTFAATVNAVLRRGARVRFADIGSDFTLDPASVAERMMPDTRAMLPVHLYGLMADMDALRRIGQERGLDIIEDAAQAHGAAQGNRRAGGTGTGVFSFYATKNITSGEGGCITTNDDFIAARLRLLRNQGMAQRYEYAVCGENWRLTEIAAAIAIPQLERLDEITSCRDRNASLLSALLRDDERLTLPSAPAGRTHAWHQYTVLIAAGIDRDTVARRMHEAGVHPAVYYPRTLAEYPLYRNHPNVVVDPTPVADDMARRCLSLPVHPGLAENELERVTTALQRALG